MALINNRVLPFYLPKARLILYDVLIRCQEDIEVSFPNFISENSLSDGRYTLVGNQINAGTPSLEFINPVR